MNRFLQLFNLFGVVALAALCCLQWRVNRHLNLEGIDQERTRLAQVAQLAEKDKAIQGYAADMNEFRQRLERSDATLQETQDKLDAVVKERDRIAADRDQAKTLAESLQSALEKWTAAVAARDVSLKQAQEQIQKIAAERNDAIAKFNDLAGKYNAAGDELKRAADQIKTLVTDRNAAVAKFNDLATKYNALIKSRDAATTKP